MNGRVWGLPPAADESAIGFEIAAMYFAALAVTLHLPFPVGPKPMPRRGPHPLSFSTCLPDGSAPWFLSKRKPTLAVRRLPTRHVSFRTRLFVRKTVPPL